MNGKRLLDLVNEMHETKRISKEDIFSGIEAAIQIAAERATGAQEEITVYIDRSTGEIVALNGDTQLDPEELGRIAAQSAKQMIIQKIREAESESIYDMYRTRLGKIESGIVQRIDNGTAIVSLGKTEAILPRSEQIPGQSLGINERVKAVVIEVKRSGQRVKIVLSRCHPNFVRCLFEENIPEIEDHTIEIKAVAREAGFRTKIAVSSIDTKVDAVGACVGVRGSRIKGIIEELGGERIDIVRWNDSLQILIQHALQPAQISEVFTYARLGRAIVLVGEDQLSLAIGRRGQNVRLASKLVGWDIEIMTHEELGRSLEKAELYFRQLEELDEIMVQALIEEGFLSYTDVTFMEPDEIAEITGLDPEQSEEVITRAEELTEELENNPQLFAEQEVSLAEAAETPEDLTESGPAEHPESTEHNLPTAEGLLEAEMEDAITDQNEVPTLEELFEGSGSNSDVETASSEGELDQEVDQEVDQEEEHRESVATEPTDATAEEANASETALPPPSDLMQDDAEIASPQAEDEVVDPESEDQLEGVADAEEAADQAEEPSETHSESEEARS